MRVACSFLSHCRIDRSPRMSLSAFSSLVLMVQVSTVSLGKQFHNLNRLFLLRKNNKAPKATSAGSSNGERREGKIGLYMPLSYYKRALNKGVTKELCVLEITVPVAQLM